MKRTLFKLALQLITLAGVLALPFLNGSLIAQPKLSAHDLEMSAPAEVVPFTVKSGNAFCYELVVHDLSKHGLRLKSVDILEDGPEGAVLKSYSGTALHRSLRKPGEGIPHDVIFIWIRQASEIPAPRTLFHRVRHGNPDSEETVTMEGAPVAVKANTGIVLKPPFTGNGWLATETASYSLSHHRKGLIDFMGKTYLSQRYAIDWLKYGPNGFLWKTDGKTNEDYYCYGEPLLAAADGVVVDARDGIPENVPDPGGGGTPAVPITFGTMGGNYAVLKIADGVYAHYCHMIPGTLAVKIGDEVKAGDALGKLGNSGNSTAPHLHFQISDSPDILRSEGLPYVFESYVFQGRVKDASSPWFPDPSKEKFFADDYPLNYSVVTFNNRETVR